MQGVEKQMGRKNPISQMNTYIGSVAAVRRAPVSSRAEVTVRRRAGLTIRFTLPAASARPLAAGVAVRFAIPDASGDTVPAVVPIGGAL